MAKEAENTSKKKKNRYKVRITPKNCKACGICIALCPVKILTLDTVRGIVKVVDETRCTGCLMCDNHCPDFAIQIQRIQVQEKEDTQS